MLFHHQHPHPPQALRHRRRRPGGPYLHSSSCLFLILAVVVACWRIDLVQGQRIKKGCYDDNPSAFATCHNSERPSQEEYDALSKTVNVEQVCLQLVEDIFPDSKVVWASDIPNQHVQYLNSVEAGTELCSNIQQSYRHCLFCAVASSGDWMDRWYCQDGARTTQCGGKLLNREDILADNETYARIQTLEDIDDTCRALAEVYPHTWVDELDVGVPTTWDLCERQALVKHVCPGFCDGTCFDAVEYPPSCGAYDQEEGTVVDDPDLDPFYVCDEINFRAFFNVEIGIIMNNVTDHLDYLRVISKDDPLCNQARQAYSQCYWCSTDRCFDDDWPTSCEPPEGFNQTDIDPKNPDRIDVQHMCKELTYAFDNVSFEDELNISAHEFLVPDNLTFCDEARQVYHLCFWCAPPTVPFEFCLPDTACDSPVELPADFVSTTLYLMDIQDMSVADLRPKCNEIYQEWRKNWSDPYSLQSCYEDIYLGRLCPEQFCDSKAANMFVPDYLGASSQTQKRALIWMSRIAAFLSFFGATYILYDSLSDKEVRGLTYNQLLVGMAVFDIVTAFAWVFATAPIDDSQAGHVEGAMGNEATCKAQAFFIQFGFTSIFYNVSLAVYYVLVIAHDYREFHLKRIRIYLHICPIALGLGLALGVIWHYHWIEYGCHILPPPEGELWKVLVFVVIPLGFSIAAITASMFVVYCKVRKQASKSKRWTLGVGQASRIQQAVFWQCLFYVLAFYITWPIMFSVYLASIDVDGPLGLTMMVAFVAPLQGFNNFLVYIRPKLRGSDVSQRRGSSSKKFSSSFMSMMRFANKSSLGTDQHHGDMDPSSALAKDNADTTKQELSSKGLRPFSDDGASNDAASSASSASSDAAKEARESHDLRRKSLGPFDLCEMLDPDEELDGDQDEGADAGACQGRPEAALEEGNDAAPVKDTPETIVSQDSL